MLGKDTSAEVPQFFYLRAFLAEGKDKLEVLPWFLQPIVSLACPLLPLSCPWSNAQSLASGLLTLAGIFTVKWEIGWICSTHPVKRPRTIDGGGWCAGSLSIGLQGFWLSVVPAVCRSIVLICGRLFSVAHTSFPEQHQDTPGDPGPTQPFTVGIILPLPRSLCRLLYLSCVPVADVDHPVPIR